MEPTESHWITWSQAEVEAFESALARRPHLSRLNHISINARDLETSKRFYADVLGGRIVNSSANFAIVMVAGVMIGISPTRGTAPFNRSADDEFPHIAFEVESEQLLPMKKWLEDHGVKTHEPWTRYQIEGLIYFKDPAGNLIELYCPEFAGAKTIRNTRNVRDVMRFADLDYDWDPKLAQPVMR